MSWAQGENVLVDTNGVAKLADFGASKQMENGTIDETHHSLKGTPYVHTRTPTGARRMPLARAAVGRAFVLFVSN